MLLFGVKVGIIATATVQVTRTMKTRLHALSFTFKTGIKHVNSALHCYTNTTARNVRRGFFIAKISL